MIIAIPYDNGNIFQHFGKTEFFKYYTLDDTGSFIKMEIKSTGGKGHGALALELKNNGADILICGGIGEGAQNALTEAGIDIYAGNMGPADAAAIAFTAGRIEKKEVACDHHHREGDHDCGHHDCG